MPPKRDQNTGEVLLTAEEWAEVSTGPVREVRDPPATCGFHQAVYKDIGILKWRMDDCREEITEMKADHKEAHVAMMQAISDHRDATRSTFEAQQRSIEEMRLASSKMGVKVALLWAAAGTAGGGLMALIIKHLGG